MRAASLGLLAALVCASCAEAKEPPQSAPRVDFYNLSDDPNTLWLLHLGEIEVDGPTSWLPVSNLTRGATNVGLYTVWEIHCDLQAMTTVEAAQFGPNFSDPVKEIEADMIRPAPGQLSGRIFEIACSDDAQLERRRVINDDLGIIRQRFWNQ